MHQTQTRRSGPASTAGRRAQRCGRAGARRCRARRRGGGIPPQTAATTASASPHDPPLRREAEGAHKCKYAGALAVPGAPLQQQPLQVTPDPTEVGYGPKTNAQVTAGPLLPRAERYEAFDGLEGCACPPLRPGLSFKGGNKPSYRQQRRTSTGTLSASWSCDLLYFTGWQRPAAVGSWRLAAVGGWLLVGGGGAKAGLKALYTCTSWYAYAAMSGSSTRSLV